MTVIDSRPWSGRFIGAFTSGIMVPAALVLAVLVLMAGPAEAAAVSIHDDSHVLDATRVQNEAATLPDPVEIFTTTKLADDKAAFDREAQAKVTASAIVVIAVNTQSHHLAIRTGPTSRVTQQAAAAATQSFIGSYRSSSDYTAATLAALGSIRGAIQAGGPGRTTVAKQRVAHSSSGVSIGGLLCLVVVIAAVVAFVVRRRRQLRGPSGPVAGYDAGGGYGPPGYGPEPGYGPGYGSGYGQPGRSGVNPWVAGGVGAAAGGLLGYELGRDEGRDEGREAEREHEERSDQSYDDSASGGADGDFGDNADGDGEF